MCLAMQKQSFVFWPALWTRRQEVREEIEDPQTMEESLRVVQARIRQVRAENKALLRNDLVCRFNGYEGDAAASALLRPQGQGETP